jgi:hypothetical protein
MVVCSRTRDVLRDYENGISKGHFDIEHQRLVRTLLHKAAVSVSVMKQSVNVMREEVLTFERITAKYTRRPDSGLAAGIPSAPRNLDHDEEMSRYGDEMDRHMTGDSQARARDADTWWKAKGD